MDSRLEEKLATAIATIPTTSPSRSSIRQIQEGSRGPDLTDKLFLLFFKLALAAVSRLRIAPSRYRNPDTQDAPGKFEK